MELDRFFFWQDWPADRQKFFFAGCVIAWGLALFMIWSGFYESQERSQSISVRSQQKYLQVQPLVEQLKAGEAARGALVEREPMAAAQQVIRDLGLDSRLTSVRPVQSGAGAGGVQVIFEALNLPEIVYLLRDFKVRGALNVSSISINHRLDSPELADVQITLSR